VREYNSSSFEFPGAPHRELHAEQLFARDSTAQQRQYQEAHAHDRPSVEWPLGRPPAQVWAPFPGGHVLVAAEKHHAVRTRPTSDKKRLQVQVARGLPTDFGQVRTMLSLLVVLLVLLPKLVLTHALSAAPLQRLRGRGGGGGRR